VARAGEIGSALIECVPNFSEGREPERIFRIIRAMRVEGVDLLDQTSDPYHNRTVITIAGAPDAVREAAVRGVGCAAELIDLRVHKGVHPRMGAADVVPFVPIMGTNLERVAALARLAGEEMWARYGVPVFFYEAAATHPSRKPLENVRRGQFEGALAEGRAPDIGDKVHGSAGAAIVGARDYLVAFNVLLETTDIGIARGIARKIRGSAGGFAAVKALGVSVKGHAQIPMNFVDYRVTGVQPVFERVRELAHEAGTEIREAELIGLVPMDALPDESVPTGTRWTDAVAGFSRAIKVLEERLVAPMAWPESAAEIRVNR
jgi:glutamate formiminotransferase